jgi:hypothetical protein
MLLRTPFPIHLHQMDPALLPLSFSFRTCWNMQGIVYYAGWTSSCFRRDAITSQRANYTHSFVYLLIFLQREIFS